MCNILKTINWVIAIHLLTSTRKSFSVKELQCQLGHKYYKYWGMLHILHQAVGNCDDLYTLSNVIELDEGFFSTEMPNNEKDKPFKRGRGSRKKSKVLVIVMVESAPIEGEKTKKQTATSRVFEND